MLKPNPIRISKKLFIGLFAVLWQLAANAQEKSVIDHKGTIIKVRNNVVTTAATEPSSPLQNDIWFDTTEEVTKIYDGTSWLTINLDALAKKEDSTNKSTDTNLSDATNTKFPTELAVKTYVDGQLATSLDDDITGVSFDGTNLKVDEGLTTFSANLSGLRDSDWFQANSSSPATDINQNIYTFGNAGIGVINPSSKLHINETTGTPASANTGTILLEYENSGGASSIVFKSRVNSGSDYGYIQFSDDASGNGSTTENALLEIGIQNDVVGIYQDDIALMPSGSVGIGTRAPSASLDINGNARIRTLATGANTDQLITTDANGNLRKRAVADVIGAGGSNIYESDGTLTSNRNITQNNFDLNFDANTLVISGDDNRVGIGTTNPNAQLDIEGIGVPLKITPNTTTPTGTQAGQIFMGTDGILYTYDGARAKWLSVDRNTVSWARGSTSTSNEYLRAHDASPSSNNGYRMIRNATITAVAAQTNTNETWYLLILKNDENVSIAYLTMTNETGKHENNTNIDIDEGDIIQAYCLGSNINHPLASIEFAWRK